MSGSNEEVLGLFQHSAIQTGGEQEMTLSQGELVCACVCACMLNCVRGCVCVCVCEWKNASVYAWERMHFSRCFEL